MVRSTPLLQVKLVDAVPVLSHNLFFSTLMIMSPYAVPSPTTSSRSFSTYHFYSHCESAKLFTIADRCYSGFVLDIELQEIEA